MSASLILGGVGAGIGSFFGAPWLGFSIGSTLGGLIDASNRPGTHTDQGRLADLKISTSSYGTAIPMCWGSIRLPGMIIFATDLQEHSQTIDQGGGGGGSGQGGGTSTTQYWYTSTFLVAFCQSSYLMADGSIVNRFNNSSLQRLWFDDMLVVDVINSADIGTTVDYNNNTVSAAIDYTFLPGNETQTADTTIAAWVAANSVEYSQGVTPAYRGIATVICRNVNLQPYGNRIPNISAELLTNTVSVGSVISDVSGLVKIPASALDLTAANAISLFGYNVPQQAAASDIVSSLTQMYFFDLPEVDGVLRAVPRGGAIVQTILLSDLNSVTVDPGNGGGQPQTGSARVTETYGQVVDLPSRLDLTYYSHDLNANLDRHFEQATQGDQRQAAITNNPIAVSVGLTLGDSQARQIAATLLDLAWLERRQFKFSLPPKYLALCCADCVYLPVGPYQYRVRIISIELGVFGQLNISAVFDDSGTQSQSVTGGNNGGIPATPSPQGARNFQAWSGTELRDADQSAPGFYVSADGPGQIFYSPNAGTTWLPAGPVSGGGSFGTASSALGNATTANVFDNTNTASITLVAGTLASTSDTAIQNGNNIAVLGNEILGVGTASIVSPLNYTISHLYRGARSSPMTGHLSGEKFTMVDPSRVVRISVNKTLIGQSVQVKVVGPQTTLAAVTVQTITIAASTANPLVTQVAALKNTPWYRSRSKYNTFNDSSGTITPQASDFTSGYTASTLFASAPDGSIHWSDPGLELSVQWRIGLQNTTGADIVVHWALPAIDNGGRGIFNGAQFFQSLASAGSSPNLTGTFTVPAGVSGILELYYYNFTTGAIYNPANPGTFNFTMDALLLPGITTYDAGA